MALVSTSCGGAATEETTISPSDTQAESSSAPTAAGEMQAAALMVDGFEFDIAPVGESCVLLTTTTPAGEVFTHEECFTVDTSVDTSPTCLERPGAPATGRGDGGGVVGETCDVEAPSVIYGRVHERIEHVCVAEWSEAGFGRVRFLPFDENRLILHQNAHTFPGSHGLGGGHHFSADGWRVGAAPTDAGAGPIYIMCAQLAPWSTGNVGPLEEFRYEAEVDVRIAEPESVRGVTYRLVFSDFDWIEFENGEFSGSSLQFVRFPSHPRLEFEGATIPLRLAPIPDASRRWTLVLVLDAGAVESGEELTVNPEAISLEWVEK